MAYHIIPKLRGVKPPPSILWVRNLGWALSRSCHQVSAGAPSKWDAQDHSVICPIVWLSARKSAELAETSPAQPSQSVQAFCVEAGSLWSGLPERAIKKRQEAFCPSFRSVHITSFASYGYKAVPKVDPV